MDIDKERDSFLTVGKELTNKEKKEGWNEHWIEVLVQTQA